MGLASLGGKAGGADLITDTPLTLVSDVWVLSAGLGTGVCTPEKSPTAPQCTLPSSKSGTGPGELGAGGRSSVGGVLLRETEQVTAPDLTSLLCVLQMVLYCLLRAKLLGGADTVTHSSITWVGGWETDGSASSL